MGRRPNRLDYTLPDRGALAALLRNQRKATGLTYHELAPKAGVSAATLKRATSGKVMPTERTVVAFIEACGGDRTDVEKGRLFWRLARMEQRGTRGQRTPHPRLISSQAELSLGLVDLYERDGLPSFREMQRRAGAEWLAISSISRIVHREALPASRGQMAAFLRACRVSRKVQSDWLDTWQRVVSRPYATTIYPVRPRRPSTALRSHERLHRPQDTVLKQESQNNPAKLSAVTSSDVDDAPRLMRR
ncbi:helix-turn-helix transcriptional regulator [Streptomyces sp. BPTC-684]|uniref:helix-turn-helix domain-containing protein n=1 Tax=Streptomyces sp. BPTC-684 TaxID=3043734 RepID=UPI0024B2768E|nr:helix-turn-helix transcriptional regulator [Streptomyces sp. BPTC-684]WHM41119.1 helix-turn-helix transcriptional regulator [Streptomyces sp. BPTC-684]